MNKKILGIVLHILYLLLCVWVGFEIVRNGVTIDDLLLITLSIFSYIIPLLSLFIPKQIHKLIYQIGMKTYGKWSSYASIKSQDDSYKNFDKICIGLLIFSNVLLSLEIVIQIMK